MAVDETALANSISLLSAAVRSIDGPPVHLISTQLTAIVGAAAEVLGVDCVGVLLLDEGGRLRSVASSTAVAAALELAQQQLGMGPGHDSQTGRRTVAVADLAEVASYAPLTAEVAPLGVRAVLSAPIWCGDLVVGNLNLIRAQGRAWTETEISAAEAYAGVVGRLLGLASDAWAGGSLVSRLRNTTQLDGSEHRADQC